MTNRASHPKCEVCKHRKSNWEWLLLFLLMLVLLGAGSMAIGWYVHTNQTALRTRYCRYAGLSGKFLYHTHPLEHIQAKGYDNWCAAVTFISANYELTVNIITQPGALFQYSGLASWEVGMTQAQNELDFARRDREATRRWAKTRDQ